MAAAKLDAKINRARKFLWYAVSAGSIEEKMIRIQRACRCAGKAYRELQQEKDRLKRRWPNKEQKGG